MTVSYQDLKSFFSKFHILMNRGVTNTMWFLWSIKRCLKLFTCETHTHTLDESSRKLPCDRVVFTTLLPLSTWIMTSHRVKMTVQKQSQAGTELCTRWNILFSLDHKKTGGKLPLRIIGSNPYSKWGYCTHWGQDGCDFIKQTLENLVQPEPEPSEQQFLAISLCSNSFHSRTAQLWRFCSSSSSCRPHCNTINLLFTRLNKPSSFNLSLPIMSCRVLIILIVLCRDLSSPLAPLKLWSPKLGTIAQVWAQCHTERSHCPWSVKYGTTQNWQLPEIPD